MPGIGRGISPLLKSGVSGGPSFPITSAFVSTVVGRGGVVTAAEQEYLSIFETSMGSNLAELDRLWIHGLSNNVAARTSFVNPTSTIITAVNSPTFTPNQGYQGNGSTSYLNTNYNPSTQGVKYTLNDASGFAYILNNITSQTVAFGSLGSGAVSAFLYPQYNSLTPLYAINDGGQDNTGTGNSLGLSSVLRINNTSSRLFKNGVLNASATRSSVTIPNLPLFIGGFNLNGNLAGGSTYKFSATGFGSSVVNQTTLYNSIQTLGTSLGWFSYTTNFKAVVESRGGTLTSTEETYLRTFEASVGSDLAKMDRLWIHGLSNEIAAKTSFVNPTSTMITGVNSPTFTANIGFTGNGSTSYLNTNFNPATHGLNYTLNTASIFQYERAAILGTYCGIGEQQSYLFPNLSGSAYFTINNGASNNTFTVANSKGFLFADRSSNNLTTCYKNGVFKSTLNNTATNFATHNFYLLALLQGGAALYASPGNVALSGIGGTGINQSNFYNAVQALGTSIGWAV